MRYLKYLLVIGLAAGSFSGLFSQENFLAEDYQIFGRREPMSLGSLFSALGTGTILVNPANVATVNDNRINFGGGGSNIGYGTFISWMAPNFALSSASQIADKNDTTFFDHEKQLLHFNFGVSTSDIGLTSDQNALAIGLAVKRQADRLLNENEETAAGGDAVSLDIGFLLKMQRLALELVLVDLNSPTLSHSEISYGKGFILGARYTTPAGLTLALQGIGGNSYADSDFGLNLGAAQSFLDHRLISRLQLTSFFQGSEAIMQNISFGIGYRLEPKHRLMSFLKDLEFSYALSFLAMPQNVGTHLFVMTKYF